MAGYLTDIKDMVIDQNEWYEEMFYPEDSCGSHSDVFDINDDLPTVSDAMDPKKGTELGPGVKKMRADQRKFNLKKLDQGRELLLGARGINTTGFSRTKTMLGKGNKSPPAKRPRNSM